MKKPYGKGLRTWIEIDTAAFRHNYEVFRQLAGKACLMAVVKSNAYGHSFIDAAQFLSQCGVDWFGVDSITEALALRREGITEPILVLGYTLPEYFSKAASQNISLTISSFESLSYLQAQNKKIKNKSVPKLKVHLKLDTGLHRQGFAPTDIDQLIEALVPPKSDKTSLSAASIFEIEGAYSHFADAVDSRFVQNTLKQRETFDTMVAQLKQKGISPLKHLSATPGLLALPDTTYDMVRIGLGLYGVWPVGSLEQKWHEKITLKPILTWKTIISEINQIKKGEAVGYGFSEVLTRDCRLAVCPVGYWHGYPRNLSSVGQTIVNGKRAKVIGRVSMDMIVIDVTDIPEAKVGDEVDLIDTEVLANEAATLGKTIPYEIITRINPLIKRIYL